MVVASLTRTSFAFLGSAGSVDSLLAIALLLVSTSASADCVHFAGGEEICMCINETIGVRGWRS